MTLFDYDSSNGDALLIAVPNVRDARVYENGQDVADRLFRANILQDSGGSDTRGESLTLALANEIADAVDSFDLFDSDATVAFVPTYDGAEADEKVVVAPDLYRLEREARVAYAETRVFRVVCYQRVDSIAPNDVDEMIRRTEELAKLLAATEYELGGRYYATSEIETELVDSDQLYQNFIYCGSVSVSLTTARAH